MRIGEITKDNYMDYVKLFGGKSAKALDQMWGKDKKTKDDKTSPANKDGKWVNPYAIEGLDITGMTEADFKIVEVSDEIREKIINQCRSDFLNGYGKTDGEAISALKKAYIMSVPASERANVAYTLDKMDLDECRRLNATVKENIPGWQSGKAFDRNAVSELISRGSLDIKA